MSLLDTASLIVTPNGYKEGTLYSVIPSDGSGDMSVVRATTATRVNSSGLVELVPYNLLTYSQEFDNADWSKIQGSGGSLPIVTANYGISPDGTQNAERIQLTRTSASGSYSYVYQAFTATIGQPYTWSVWLKSLSGTPSVALTYKGSGSYSNIVTLTNEWERYEFTTNATGTACQATFLLFENSPSTSLTADFLAYGFQVVEGSVAKDYQPTETRLNIPRLDYSNGTCPSLLVEPQRTNVLTWSSSFDTNLPWQPYGGLVITSNNTISPDGTMNADKFSVNGVYSTNFIFAINSAYALSIFIKKDTATSFSMGYVDTSAPVTGGSISYNFATEVITVTQSPNSSVSGTAENYGNDWVRLTILFTTNVAKNYNYIEIGFIGGSGWIYGAQLEVGSYPTSYIPTTSASVTRNADVISKTGISSLIGQTEGTLFVDLNITNMSSAANLPIPFYINQIIIMFNLLYSIITQNK